ncbi:MAG: FAD:protein FMN transferase [Clostridiales Family XIII bacterium]|jgi:thiamine biosynthesis lipoprotein|nr:FAD:protein FMN transferase [Clostridiales Family XIII bacterium]
MKKFCIGIKKTTIVILFSAAFLMSSCGDSGNEPIRKSEFLLDTLCSVTVFSKEDEKFAEGALDLCARYDALFARSSRDGDVSKINEAGGRETTVTDDTAALLETALRYGALSDGAFDITIGRISSLWDFSSDLEARDLPSASDIEAALPSVNYRNVELLGNRVRLKDPATRLDLGGIAKGFIADKMASYLAENGVSEALIDLGGNIVTVGEKSDGGSWRVGVKNPLFAVSEDSTSSLIGVIEVEGTKSVGTSGVYERSFVRDGTRYHHILDPKTGFPARTDLVGVTVVTERSVDGEGISTMCVIFGSARAQEYLEQNGIPAVLVKEDGTVITTGGIDCAMTEE